MKAGTPFRAAQMMAAALAVVVRETAHLGPVERQRHLQEKLLGLGPLRHRGHGRGAPSRRFGNDCNNGGVGVPHQGKRECARRLRQATVAGIFA